MSRLVTRLVVPRFHRPSIGLHLDPIELMVIGAGVLVIIAFEFAF